VCVCVCLYVYVCMCIIDSSFICAKYSGGNKNCKVIIVMRQTQQNKFFRVFKFFFLHHQRGPQKGAEGRGGGGEDTWGQKADCIMEKIRTERKGITGEGQTDEG
jgi:hypothetical protein